MNEKDPTVQEWRTAIAERYRREVNDKARELYEDSCEALLYVTVAAWVRWDDLEPEVQDGWRLKARRLLRDT